MWQTPNEPALLKDRNIVRIRARPRDGLSRDGDAGATIEAVQAPFPFPGKQFVQARGGHIGDPSQDIGEPGVGIGLVEACGRDERQHDGGTVSAARRTGECPIAAPESHCEVILPVSTTR